MWLDVQLSYASHSHAAICRACDPAGTEDSSEVYTQLLRSLFKWYWASCRDGLHGKSKPPATGDTGFHARAERLNSSFFHRVALNHCISLSRKCSWVPSLPSPALARIYCCTLRAVCCRSLPSLGSQLTRQTAVKGDRELFWFKVLCWGLADSISTSSVLLVAMGYSEKLFLKMQEVAALFLAFPNFAYLTSTLCRSRAGIFSWKISK